MYAEHVEIWVDGRRVTVLVPCEPNTPKNELKRMAIKIYVHKLEDRLYGENNISR